MSASSAKPNRYGSSLPGDYLPAVLLAAVMIGLTWHAGFYDDDSVISLWREQMLQAQVSLWHYCWSNFTGFIHFQGRFPLVFSLGILPILIGIGDHLAWYRLYFAAAYLLSFLLMQRGLARIFNSHLLASLVLAVFVAGVQLQNYHDSYTSYFAYLPLLAAFIIGGLASYDRLVEAVGGAQPIWGRHLWIHLGWVLAAMLTWEIAIVLAAGTAIHALVSRVPGRRKLALAAVPVIWGLVFVGINLVLKQHSTNAGTTISMSSLPAIGHAYIVQLAGTLPLAVGSAGCPSVWHSLPPLVPAAGFAGLIVMFVLWRALRVDPAPTDCRRLLIAFCYGACCVLVPPALTAVTAKYQRELAYGMAYLQLFIQNLGLAMMLAATLASLVAPKPWMRLARIGFGAATVAVLALHFSRNVRVIAYRNAFWLAPRQLAANALESMPDGAAAKSIVVTRDYLMRWENVDFSRRHLGRAVPFVPAGTYRQQPIPPRTLVLAYSRYVPRDAPGVACAGWLSAGSCTTGNVLVVTRPPGGAPAWSLEYEVEAPPAPAALRSRQIPPADDPSPYDVITEPARILRGSVRLVVKP